MAASHGPTDLQQFIAKRRAEIPGLTQAKLAKAIGIKVGEYISLVESGKRRIPLERIAALADALGQDRVMLIKWAFSEEHPIAYSILFGARSSEILTSLAEHLKLRQLAFERDLGPCQRFVSTYYEIQQRRGAS